MIKKSKLTFWISQKADKGIFVSSTNWVVCQENQYAPMSIRNIGGTSDCPKDIFANTLQCSKRQGKQKMLTVKHQSKVKLSSLGHLIQTKLIWKT